jgi:hypothetical protein
MKLIRKLVEAAGIETCVAPMKTQRFQFLRPTPGGVRVECSDERMQQHDGVHPFSRSRRMGGVESSCRKSARRFPMR